MRVMLEASVPFIVAFLVWWSTTGAILFLVRRAPSTFNRSLAGATVMLLASGYGLDWSTDHANITGAYVGFAGAVGLWGWLEITFLTGFITGPRVGACGDRCTGWPHFLHAIQAILYNELATAILALSLYAVSRETINRVGLYTFLLLWGMRVSAKLNLHLGVPNLGEQLLPDHLKYLMSFFRARSINPVFPASAAAGTAVAGVFLAHLMSAASPFEVTAAALLLSLATLGLLEHVFMVLPFRSDRLWMWAANLAGTLAIPNPR